MAIAAIQTALRVIYPPCCTLCGGQVDSEFGLCGPCWRDTPIITGLVCDTCGAPLPGEAESGRDEKCDACLSLGRPWRKGRSALIYKDNARRLVLGLKHGDRHESVPLLTKFMMRAAIPLLEPDVIFVPVPLHWTRLMRRRFNQSALLAQALARQMARDWCPDALSRVKRTPKLDGLGVEGRFAAVEDTIRSNKARRSVIAGRVVIVVDDVMTSGATMAACVRALQEAGAGEVRTLALARVVKDA